MNKISKYKIKNNISQEYIKVTKKGRLDKNSIINNINNSKKISQKKLKFSFKDSSRRFGEDISTKIQNSISPIATHNQNRKSLSNIDEKVIILFFNIFFSYLDFFGYKKAFFFFSNSSQKE